MNKYSLEVTNKFKKDFRQCIKRGLPIHKLQDAMRLLENSHIATLSRHDKPEI